MRKLNLKRSRTEDVQSLDLDSFTEFFLQIAHNVFYCKEKRVRSSVIEQMETLLKHMQKAMLYKGEPVNIYEDPDYVVGLDKARLKELNRQIVTDPAMPVPDGYYKVYEKEQFYEHTLPDYLAVKESQRVAAETLDAIVADIFGIHLLEARAYTAVVP